MNRDGYPGPCGSGTRVSDAYRKDQVGPILGTPHVRGREIGRCKKAPTGRALSPGGVSFEPTGLFHSRERSLVVHVGDVVVVLVPDASGRDEPIVTFAEEDRQTGDTF